MDTIKLSIADPCHENWAAMHTDEQGRFCDSCKKSVIDFTVMDNNEIYNTILKSSADVCGRLTRQQMDSVINLKTNNGQRWHKYFFGFLVPAFLFSKQAAAQKKMGKIAVAPPVCTSVTMGAVVRVDFQKHFEFSGVVVDADNKEGISNVTVQLVESDTKVESDSAGNFFISSGKAIQTATIIFNASGFKTKEIKVTVPAGNFILLNEIITLQRDIKLLPVAIIIAGESSKYSIMAGGVSTRYVKQKNPIKYIGKKISIILKDSLSNNSIKIFPDPVQRGSFFTASLQLKKADNYTLQIIDVSGQLLWQQQLIAVSKTPDQNIECSNKWGSGIYFLRVVSQDKKLISTRRFLVQ